MRLAPLLLVLAALAVVASAVLPDGAPPPPDCGEPCSTLVVGASLPLTGVLAPFGLAQQRGAQQAVDALNRQGGLEVDGALRPVELLVRDSRSLPDVAAQQALILVRGRFRVLALLGPCAPPTALVRVAESRGVPLVAGCQPVPRSGVGALRSTFQVSPTEQARALAVVRALGDGDGRRLGLFLTNDRSGDALAAAAGRAGFAVVDTYRPQGRGWGPSVERAAADGLDVVVAVTEPPAGIELWRALTSSGVDLSTAYASEAGLSSAWPAALGTAGDGVLTDVVGASASGAVPPVPEEAVATFAAELTAVLLDGLRRADAPSREAVGTALTSATGRVAGSRVRLADDRSSPLPPRLGRWQDGRLVEVGRSS